MGSSVVTTIDPEYDSPLVSSLKIYCADFPSGLEFTFGGIKPDRGYPPSSSRGSTRWFSTGDGAAKKYGFYFAKSGNRLIYAVPGKPGVLDPQYGTLVCAVFDMESKILCWSGMVLGTVFDGFDFGGTESRECQLVDGDEMPTFFGANGSGAIVVKFSFDVTDKAVSKVATS